MRLIDVASGARDEKGDISDFGTVGCAGDSCSSDKSRRDSIEGVDLRDLPPSDCRGMFAEVAC